MAKAANRQKKPDSNRLKSSDPAFRRELWVVAVLTLVGAIVRLRGFAHLGLTHFDEGVYAFAGLWSVTPNGLDPQVVAYAPPGFPLLVGISYTVLGVADSSAILVSVVCGVITIPVSAWVGRRTFGPGAGAATAAFAALAMAHIAFSRKALTDAPFLLCWLIAVGVGGWFLEKPRFSRALLLGIAVGLAQNFKYNGWISGVIVGFAAMFGLLADREQRRPRALARTFGLGLLAAVVAGTCYLPWYLYVEDHGGYAGLIRHQQSYLGPSGSWFTYLRQQLAQVIALSGGIGWMIATWTAAWLGCAFTVLGSGIYRPASRLNGTRLRLGWLLGVIVVARLPDSGWWLGLATVPWFIFDRRPAIRMLASWWLVLSVMTPFYHPYARLWLPLHAAGWLILAGLVVRIGPFSAEQRVPIFSGSFYERRGRFLVQAAVQAGCLLVAGFHWGENPPWPLPASLFFERTDDLRNVAAAMNDSPVLKANRGTALRVYARRPLYFYLALNGLNPSRLVPDGSGLVNGSGPSGDWGVWDELLPLGTAGATAARVALRDHWSFRGSWATRLDPVTLLDNAPEAVQPAHFREPSWIQLLAPNPRVEASGPARAVDSTW